MLHYVTVRKDEGKRKRASVVEFPLHKVATKQPEKQLKKLRAGNGSPSTVEGLEVPIVPQPDTQKNIAYFAASIYCD